jgi:hypothetical protein
MQGISALARVNLITRHGPFRPRSGTRPGNESQSGPKPNFNPKDYEVDPALFESKLN